MTIVYTITAPDGEHEAIGDEAFDKLVDHLQAKYPNAELKITGALFEHRASRKFHDRAREARVSAESAA